MSINLLITLRSAAVAYHFIELHAFLKRDSRFNFTIASQSPATEILAEFDIPTIELENTLVLAAEKKRLPALEQIAKTLIEAVKPDVILTGSSVAFDAGIDEVIHLVRGKIPTATFQYHWGLVNDLLNAQADLQLVLDAEAVKITEQNWGEPSLPVGSMRHAGYRDLNFSALRKKLRDDINLNSSNQIHTFFGQGLHNIKGYRETVADWASLITQASENITALYIPHPREKTNDRKETLKLMHDCGLSALENDSLSSEEATILSDFVYSLFSNSNYDAGYLNYFSPEPLATPINLFYMPDIKKYFSEATGMIEQPFFKLGINKTVYQRSLLQAEFAKLDIQETKEKYWLAAKNELCSPISSSIKTSEIIESLAKKGISDTLDTYQQTSH